MEMGTPASPFVFKNATEIADWRLCIGCGACVSVCPDKTLAMVDFVDDGLRPVGATGDCTGCSDCVSVCPGVEVSHGPPSRQQAGIASLREAWGPVLEVWEGYAADPDLRFGGSSGGLASALAMYCLEHEEMRGVAHVGHDPNDKFKNKSAFSRTRDEILAATGSRYSPASPCDILGELAGGDRPSVFLGKPCDVAGLRKVQAIRPALDRNVGVAIGIFCAGTPSTRGTLDLLRKHAIQPGDVEELRYRGRGWPGSFAVRLKGDDDWKVLATYQEAWSFLQAYRPYRCHLCPDSTSEFADISCGDPWYREIQDGEVGTSLVLVRTERGREIVQGAIRAGYVQLRKTNPEMLPMSQKELQNKRGAIWGRVTTLKALGIPAPHFEGFALFSNWRRIPFGQKVRSIVGTARRALQRRYYRKSRYMQGTADPAAGSQS